MKIYYFYDADEEEPEESDWNIFNLCLPYGLLQNHDFIVINAETGIKGLSKSNHDDTVKPWPYKLPDKAFQLSIEAAFAGKV
jgi:hypothetical protein